jgi:ATP-dependent Lon protease
MISSDPLEPGSVYAASVDDEGMVGLYRLEVGCSGGTGKLRLAGGIDGVLKESIQRAFGYLHANKVRLSIGQDFDTTDFHVEAIDLLQNRVSCECGVALIVAIISAIKRLPVQAALVILGDVSIQGNIKGVRTLVEPCQLAMENGARRALIPIENRRQFLEVSGDVAERLDPIFFGDAPVAANKALGIT